MGVINYASRSSIHYFEVPTEFSPEDILSRVVEGLHVTYGNKLDIAGSSICQSEGHLPVGM